MTIHDLHSQLAKLLLDSHPSEEDGLSLMLLFHTHRIRLRTPVLEDRPGVTEVAAITQRHAADAIAQAWPNRSHADRTDYRYWYRQFNSHTPFEVVGDLPPEWLTRVQRLRDLARGKLQVELLEPED